MKYIIIFVIYLTVINGFAEDNVRLSPGEKTNLASENKSYSTVVSCIDFTDYNISIINNKNQKIVFKDNLSLAITSMEWLKNCNVFVILFHFAHNSFCSIIYFDEKNERWVRLI
jgi:hypothetical protein